MERPLHDLNIVYTTFFTRLDIISLIVLLITLYLLHYFTNVVQKPAFYCSEYSPYREQLLNHLQELKKDIYPLIWCYRPLIQSFIHTVFMFPPDIPFKREEVWTRDGGLFTLDFYGFSDDDNDKNNDSNKPIVLLFPGATGHSEKIYVREYISCCLHSDYRAIGFNFRGMLDDIKLENARLSCVTNSEDIEATFDFITHRYPSAPIMVVGFSIGACTFMNYLVRKGKNVPMNLVAANVVGTPWDPKESKHMLSKFWNNLIINKHMTNNLLNTVNSNYKVVEKHITTDDIPINLKELHKCRTVWDFDDRYICPMYGYKNHAEYYDDASLKLLPLENISIPVLCVCSADDPLCREQAIPLEKIIKNPLLAVVVTKYGGHLAWFEGIFLTKKRFIHRLFLQYTNIFFKSKETEFE